MTNQDGGWREVYSLTQPSTTHPEEDVQRRQLAAHDAARRALLPQREAQLLEAAAVAREKAAAVDAAKAALAVATDANARKYREVTGGRGVRDPLLGVPIHWLDDPRTEPELTRRKLAEQVLSAASAELTQAVGQRDWLHAEVCYITTTVPAKG